MEDLTFEELKICSKCEQSKYICDYPKAGKKDKTKIRNVCKSCWNEYNRNYHIINNSTEKYKETRISWKKDNIENIRLRHNTWRKEKIQTDTLFKLKCNIRSLISISFKNKNVIKKSKTFKILGCDYEFFKYYISAQFTDNMNFNNIHLDHIRPISLAKTENELIELNHYTNFQPLFIRDNIIKNNKLINKQLRLL